MSLNSNNYLLLSHIISNETPSYGDRDRFYIEQTSKISDGASANSSKWIFTSNHLGTHIDVPKHFFDNGMTITDYPANFWFCNQVQLVDIPINTAR